jgi:tetratricopeptide (TPR) repeat protein
MNTVITLLLTAAFLSAEGDPKATAEATAGLTLAREGKYALAIPHYRAALALDPNIPGLYLNLGLAYFKTDKFPEAATAFEKATQADPGNFQARALLGMSYFGSRRFDAAAVQLKQAADLDPENIELRYKLAQSYLWSKQYPSAIEQFRLLLLRDPDSAPIHMLLGEVLDAANKEDQATAEFEAAVKVAPHQPEAHFGLGYMYWKQRRFEEASREFRAELADQPEHTQALTYLGDAEMHSGNSQSAREYLQRALKLDAKIRLVHLDLGIILIDHKDYAQAEFHLREAIRLDPSKPDAHYRLGKLWSAVGREKEAEAEFAKVKELANAEQVEPLISVPGRKGQPVP